MGCARLDAAVVCGKSTLDGRQLRRKGQRSWRITIGILQGDATSRIRQGRPGISCAAGSHLSVILPEVARLLADLLGWKIWWLLMILLHMQV
jgi:hypothetical protein